MASETAVGSGQNGRSQGDMMGGVSSFGHNLVSLAGLQAKLFALDARATMASAMPALVAAGVAVASVVASLILGLGGLSLWLASQLSWPPWGALMLVGVVTLLVSGAVAASAVRHIAKSCQTFRRSSEELERNLAWIKTVLAQSGRD